MITAASTSDAEERGNPRGLPRGDQLYDVREGLDDAGELTALGRGDGLIRLELDEERVHRGLADELGLGRPPRQRGV